MTFLHYLADQRTFLLTYVSIMLFLSALFLVGSAPEQAASNVIYGNMGGIVLAALYIGVSYRQRDRFYRQLGVRSGSGPDEWIAALPDARNYSEALILQLFREQHRMHGAVLQALRDEKREHQDFILSWIHEVKLPIAASRLLMENSEGKAVDDLVDVLEDELDKIDHYVEQALYYSRIDSFSRDYLITDTPLQSVIKDSLKKYAKLFITKGIALRLPDGDAGTVVQSDRKWLSYIIDQILVNSLKYTDDGGMITIAFEEDDAEKRCIITDTGIGIRAEDMGRVFDRGFTGTVGRTHAKSTGMGLYLAKQMAAKLGHDLTVRSEAGSGTSMTVHYPKFRNYTRF
jgi:signal transduction histidine kinase